MHARGPGGQNHRGGIQGWLKTNLAPMVLDLVVFFGVAAWWAQGPPGFILALLVALLLRIPAVDRFFPVRLAYLLIAFLFVDSVLVGLFPLWCVSRFGFVVAVGATAALAIFLVSRRQFGARGVLVSFVPMLSVVLVLVSAANESTGPRPCASVADDPRIRQLVDYRAADGTRGTPRFVERRPGHGDMLVSYRISHASGPVDVHLDRVDPLRGSLEPVTAVNKQVIGLYYDRSSGYTYVAVVDDLTDQDLRNPKSLYILDGALKLVRQVRFPTRDRNEYNAFFMHKGGALYIQSERLYRYDLLSGDFRVEPQSCMTECSAMAETGFVQLNEEEWIVSGSSNPLLYTLGPFYAACRCSPGGGVSAGYRSPTGGAYDVAAVPERGELLTSSFWRDKVWVFDLDSTELLRELKVGPCVRTVAWAAADETAYAHECFSGYLNAFDLETGAVRERYYVGANTRKVYAFADLGVVVLSSCGIYQIRPQGSDVGSFAGEATGSGFPRTVTQGGGMSSSVSDMGNPVSPPVP